MTGSGGASGLHQCRDSTGQHWVQWWELQHQSPSGALAHEFSAWFGPAADVPGLSRS